MSTILVTGGAGFIGSHLTAEFIQQGHYVRVFDNLSTGKKENLAHLNGESYCIIEGDIRNFGEVAAASEGVEAIFHQAALVSVPQSVQEPLASLQINALGTGHVFEAARQSGITKVVFASSAAVYGNPGKGPIGEDVPMHPLSPYGLDKCYSEQLASMYARYHGVNSVGLRYFNVFGPRQDPGSPYSGVLSIFLDRIYNRQPLIIYGDGHQSRDFVFVRDVVQANLLAWRAMEGWSEARAKFYNIGTGKRISLNEIIDVLKDSISNESNRDIAIRYEPERAGDIRDSQADISRAHRELAYVPQYPFAQAVAYLMASA